MLKRIFTSLCLFVSCLGFAQKTGKYFIELTDKKDSPFSLSRPLEFLSQRSVDRRVKQNVPLTERDLPVNPQYVSELVKAGAIVWYTSRWKNGVLLECADSVLTQIRTFPFVKVSDPKTFDKVSARAGSNGSVGNSQRVRKSVRRFATKKTLSPQDYGSSYNQNHMIGVDQMHRQGFTGNGMLIAVMDAGFYKVDQVPCLQHLFENKKILATYDFVAREKSVFEDDNHGLEVLSVIAGYQPGSLIGSAYEADFLLLRTEDNRSEYRIEEVNWLIAAEFADSAGVDVINTSLGYNLFTNPKMNYKTADLNGKTAFISQAASLAAATGILVVCSAGNEGADTWQTITPPADADSVLTVGAVNSDGEYAGFSSRGYAADGRIKPDVCVQGAGTTIASPGGGITTGSGTSFAAPLMAGMATGFWQAHPELTVQQVLNYLRRSASQYEKPDPLLGYGIPDFLKANKLAGIDKLDKEKKYTVTNPVENTGVVIYIDTLFKGESATVWLTDSQGKIVLKQKINRLSSQNMLYIPASVAPGTYVLKFVSENLSFTERIVKL
jgi:serine protease AprX